MKMGFSLAKAGKAVFDIGTGNPLGLLSTGIGMHFVCQLEWPSACKYGVYKLCVAGSVIIGTFLFRAAHNCNRP